MLNAAAKSSCFNVRVIKKKKNQENTPLNSVPVVEDKAKREGDVL